MKIQCSRAALAHHARTQLPQGHTGLPLPRPLL